MAAGCGSGGGGEAGAAGGGGGAGGVPLVPPLLLPLWTPRMCLAEFLPLAAERLQQQLDGHAGVLAARVQVGAWVGGERWKGGTVVRGAP